MSGQSIEDGENFYLHIAALFLPRESDRHALEQMEVDYREFCQ